MKTGYFKSFVALLIVIAFCCVTGYAERDFDYRYELGYYTFHSVTTRGRGKLVFQKEPRGTFMPDHQFDDGDVVYVYDDEGCRLDGYSMAYDKGEYGYVDASYIDWDNVPGICPLEENVTYTNFDLDHNGSKDTLTVSISRDTGFVLHVTVNGMLSEEFDLGRSTLSYLVSSVDGNSFLVTMFAGFGFDDLCIWKYRDGTWVNALSNRSYIGNFILSGVDLAYVEGNDLYVILSTGKQEKDYISDQNMRANYLAVYEMGAESVSLKSRYAEPLTKTVFIANMDFTTNHDELSDKRQGPTVYCGQMVRQNRLYISPTDDPEYDQPVFEITVDGKTGWINSNIFSEAQHGTLLTEVYDDRYDLANYIPRKVHFEGDDVLTLLRSPSDNPIPDMEYKNSDAILVNKNWCQDDYCIAWANGHYGYAPTDYIDWNSVPNLLVADDGFVYRDFDFDHDGIKDTFYSKREERTLHTFINGKQANEIDLVRGGWSHLVTSDDGQTFLAIHAGGFGFNHLFLYRYMDGVWVNALAEGNSLGYYALGHAELYKVEENRLYVAMKSGKHDQEFDFCDHGDVEYIVTYGMSGDTVRLLSRYAEPIGLTEFIAKKDFATAKDDYSVIADGPFVKKGQKVTLKRMYMLPTDENNYNEPVFEIEVDGKTGWINRNITGDCIDGALLAAE